MGDAARERREKLDIAVVTAASAAAAVIRLGELTGNRFRKVSSTLIVLPVPNGALLCSMVLAIAVLQDASYAARRTKQQGKAVAYLKSVVPMRVHTAPTLSVQSLRFSRMHLVGACHASAGCLIARAHRAVVSATATYVLGQ